MLPTPGQSWSSEIQDVLEALQTGQHGLSEQEAARRLSAYGKNIFQNREKKSAVAIFLKQLTSPLIFILIGAAIITVFLKEWVEVAVISLAVLVNAVLGFYREYHAENTLEKLSTFIKHRSRVIRGGNEEEVDSETVVPGDILKLSYGSRVPADARIILETNLRINESILTGESVPVEKTIHPVSISAGVPERTNMAYAGTLVVDGFATAVVVATGNHTEIGKIAGLVSGTKRAKTPIQKSIASLAWVIFSIVIVIVCAIFALGVSRDIPFFDMLILSAAVSVGAVPEALPIVLTVILSIGAERIARKRGVVRTLMAAETLGSTTLIMTDKTGTLTEADMKLVGIYSVEDLRLGDTAPKAYSAADREALGMALSNVDVLVENPSEPVSLWTFTGKPFEINIARAARDNGIDVRALHEPNASPIVIPFNSTHKFSVARFEDTHIAMGAPDILLARSKTSKEDYLQIESWINKASAEGMRLIALGKLPKVSKKQISVTDVSGMEFIGILAFHDPVRPTVAAAVKTIQSLGTKIIMVTGDLKGTAMAVAKGIGWDVSDEQVLTGRDLQTLTDEELLNIIPTIKIFARVTPEDKLRIGTLYRRLGEVVAMTGDGVNDAPALKAMDIGIALGSGSDVAKSTADLVLLNDNFEIISMAMQEGRRILANIRKAFVYLMSNSLDEVCVIGGSLLVGIPLPLTALQIIWVNLFTGSLPALSFAYDQNFDREKANRRTVTIFTKEVNMLTFGIGILSSLLLFFMYFALIRSGIDLAIARTVFFICFASYILVITYSFRSLHKPLFSYPVFSNRKLNQSILIAVLMLIATIAITPLRNIFGLTIIPAVWAWFVLGWLVVNVLIVEGAKYLFRRKK